jgi:hypothetical protein
MRARQVKIHPSSVNSERSKFASPWLVYHEKVETTAVYLRDSTVRRSTISTLSNL